MKHGRRLTRKQKIYLAEKGLDPKDWLVVKDTTSEIVFVHRITKELKRYGKGGYKCLKVPVASVQ